MRCREPGSLTGQNAEPVGMKLTLFLSGQEKRGTDVEPDCLELKEKHLQCLRITHSRQQIGAILCKNVQQSIIPHLLKSFNLLTALWWLSLEHVAVVGFG